MSSQSEFWDEYFRGRDSRELLLELLAGSGWSTSRSPTTRLDRAPLTYDPAG